jgi:hypothetical protein
MGGRLCNGGRALAVAFVAAASLLILASLLITSSARADLAGGRAAFDRGDYAAAEAAWRPFADQGNVDGEFGLGEVYEQAKGDYKQAALWYVRAAEHGSATARYRLALIALAGNGDTPPDLAKAYEWALLAADKEGQSGRLADDLLRLIKPHLDVNQRSAGQQQAAVWRLTHGEGRSEQADQLQQLGEALKGLECASLHIAAAATSTAQSGVVISGTVPSDAENADLVRVSNRLMPTAHATFHVDIVPKPLCQSLQEFDKIRTTGLAPAELDARLTGNGYVYHEDDPFGVAVTAANYPVYVRIDYFSLDGRVLHLVPNGDQPSLMPAGSQQVFDYAWTIGGKPFGTEFVSVLATPQPLDVGQRPGTEEASDYLAALETALRASRAPSEQPNRLATLLIHTAAKTASFPGGKH